MLLLIADNLTDDAAQTAPPLAIRGNDMKHGSLQYRYAVKYNTLNLLKVADGPHSTCEQSVCVTEPLVLPCDAHVNRLQQPDGPNEQHNFSDAFYREYCLLSPRDTGVLVSMFATQTIMNTCCSFICQLNVIET